MILIAVKRVERIKVVKVVLRVVRVDGKVFERDIVGEYRVEISYLK